MRTVKRMAKKGLTTTVRANRCHRGLRPKSTQSYCLERIWYLCLVSLLFSKRHSRIAASEKDVTSRIYKRTMPQPFARRKNRRLQES